jgi:hypothetical protein
MLTASSVATALCLIFARQWVRESLVAMRARD